MVCRLRLMSRVLRKTCRSSALGGGLLLGMCIIMGGCSKPPASVTGIVTYKGKPLTSGSVTFFCDQDNAVVNAKIDSDGSYKTPATVPPGRARIAIVSAPEANTPIGMSMRAEDMGGPSGEKYTGNPALKKTAKPSSTACQDSGNLRRPGQIGPYLYSQKRQECPRYRDAVSRPLDMPVALLPRCHCDCAPVQTVQCRTAAPLPGNMACSSYCGRCSCLLPLISPCRRPAAFPCGREGLGR